ncbi:universal stress protein [Desulforhopalus sp. IMCC35007]|uniref:universal stress protein n=1 Tax=Desulforhopalus sp. IMCC35007 TaxID=2569543 RepID=UPI0010ADD881|nr:universal stress protein [Desulforhopalus sp. IMCC35007]TKB06885.1 universal stress protein [Desulforhopalus sp. IMCC35007]
MERHFLATISNEIDHLSGVRFLCTFFNTISNKRFTIFHIYPKDNPQKAPPSFPEKSESSDETATVSTDFDPRLSIQKAQQLLTDRSVPPENIVIKTVPEKAGKVKDILAECAQGHYDAIVLGRRASYLLQWMFDRPSDETFQAMIRESSCVSPFWICPDTDPKRRNVLLCIDGSENCYRAVAHVGSILARQDQHTITLLYVEKNLDIDCVAFFEKATSILLSHKINAKRINRSVVWGLSVSGTILAESAKESYAVVAIGLGGRKNETGGGRIAGPTAIKLISKLEKTSLWCCP